MTGHRDVYLVFDKKLVEVSKNIPNIGPRAAVVHSLISSYNLFASTKVCPGEEATDEDLLSFHSADYIQCLKKAQTSTDLEKMADSEDASEFNLEYDCPLFENIYEFAKLIAGSSVTAAKKLTADKKHSYTNILKTGNSLHSKPKSYLKFKQMSALKKPKIDDVYELPGNLTLEEADNNEDLLSGESENLKPNTANVNVTTKLLQEHCGSVSAGHPNNAIAINWFGGWHHAQRDEAEGFCYVNDIVISIQHLLKSFSRVLYIDLDIHHGNGVENAFLFSPRVLTLSIHKYEVGFFPASGALNDIGEGNGKYFTINVPLKGGITNDKYVNIFKTVATKILNKYQPQCVVVQCGADTIAGDPLGGFNVTPIAMGQCLKYILEKNLPTLILGGGGYNIPNAARYWTYLTGVIVGSTLSNDIPDNSFFHLFGPDFELEVTPTLRKDENSEEYLAEVLQTVLKNLGNLPQLKFKESVS